MKEFYDRGARYMSLAHNGHSQLSDSNTGEATNDWMWQRPLAARQAGDRRDEPARHHDRRLASVEGVDDADARADEGADHRVALGGARALQPLSRNLDDEQLLALKKNGGVVQMVAFRSYVKCDSGRTTRHAPQALAALNQQFGISAARRAGGGGAPAPRGPTAGDAGQRLRAGARAPRGGISAAVQQQLAAMPAHAPTEYRSEAAGDRREVSRARPRATVKDFVDHIDYAVKLIGIDHVGISSDFDGGGGVDGLQLRRETFNVTRELRAARLHRGADRQDLERQPAAGDGRGGAGGEEAPERGGAVASFALGSNSERGHC